MTRSADSSDRSARPRKGAGVARGIVEARCERCGETFNPTGEEATTVVDGVTHVEHYVDSNGFDCGGSGPVVGEWVEPTRCDWCGERINEDDPGERVGDSSMFAHDRCNRPDDAGGERPGPLLDDEPGAYADIEERTHAVINGAGVEYRLLLRDDASGFYDVWAVGGPGPSTIVTTAIEYVDALSYVVGLIRDDVEPQR